ncbi:hypothetical protein FGG08_007403 [Glutinoglossum americanum]|uniref:Mediator of RNA polymerase II transcription subunit 4 n=1 Tax=Glutinoglossum americanum TaxID=1670608 RepID=A0A9P8I1I0_9PEZI|nr:hypothetical protein FGG08_007403 [Glutinoglossum americanum]
MNTDLQSRFERVETALNALLDSISSYNPSTRAAAALVEADDDLSKGLEQRTFPHNFICPSYRLSILVARHQQNYNRILTLKQTTASLDAQIKSTLELLADTRKELLATPATAFPESAEVPYGELLAYAKRISKFTVPPTYRAPPPAPKKEQDTKEQQNGDPNGAAMRANGSSISPVDAESQAVGKDSKGIGIASLENEEVLWLDPESQMPFVPWPSEETIRRGALSQIQFMVEQDLDPSAQANLQEQEAAARDKEKLEEEDKKRKAKEREAAAATARKHSSAVGAAPAQGEQNRQQQQPALWGIDLYDPEDD